MIKVQQIVNTFLLPFTSARLPGFVSLLSFFLCAFTSSAFAQNDKQVSYSVALPVSQAASTSSLASAPALKAPEPIIRPIDQAATVPVKIKTATKKKPVEDDDDDEDDDDKQPAPPKKLTANKKLAQQKSSAASKKATVAKLVVEKKPTVDKKSVSSAKAITDIAPSKVSAIVNKKNDIDNPGASDTKVVADNKIETKTNLAAPTSASAMATAIALDDEATLSASLASEEEARAVHSTEIDSVPATHPVAAEAVHTDPNPVSATKAAVTMNTSPLPMSNQREKFVNDFKDYVETKIVPNVPGVAVAVIAEGKVKVLQAYGMKKSGGSDPINTETAFRLASVSKTIAGTTASVMVHDGLMSWDTPIVSILPNIEFSNPRYASQLTVRNILSQATGLPTHSGDNYIEDDVPFDEVVEKLKYVNFVCPPGKCYAYQNVTFSLLSNIVRKKTGKPYEQYVKEKLFMPLGMHNASIGMEGLLSTNNYALPHVITGHGRWYTEKITENYYRLNPAAGGNASISDMSRWVLAQMGHNPDVLSSTMLTAIHDKVTKNTPAQSHYGAQEGVTDTHYGIGWRTFDYRGDKSFLHHGGYVLGYRSEMVFNPELQIGMVILSNCNKLSGDIIFKFLDAYEDEKHGAKPKTPPPPVVKSKKKK